MKDPINKKVWTTTKKAEGRSITRAANRMLWLMTCLVGALVVFSSLYFQMLRDSSALMAAFIIVGLVIMLVIARYTNQGEKGWQFVLDSRVEMRKVVWPTRQETINSTLIVLVIVVIASLIIYFVGLLFMHLIQAILS